MYRIIAAKARVAAILEKAGQLYWSYAPEFMGQIRERDLMREHPECIDRLVKADRFKKYDPPLELGKLEDWPNVIREARRKIRSK